MANPRWPRTPAKSNVLNSHAPYGVSKSASLHPYPREISLVMKAIIPTIPETAIVSPTITK